MAHYLVTHRNHKGQIKGVLDDIIFLHYTLPLNQYGVSNLRIPTSYDFNSIHDYDRLRIERQGVVEGDTDWFIIKYGYEEDAQGREYIKMVAFSALYLAFGPLVRYPAGNALTIANSEYSDDIIKRIMRENAGGSTTDTARTIPSDLFTVDSPTLVGDIDSKSYSNRRAIEVMKELADKNGIYYDIVLKNTDTNQLIFKTYYPYRGSDKSGQITFSKDKRNLKSPSLMYDFSEEWTAAHVGGRGEQETRDVQSAYSERHDHPWARVREGWATAYKGSVQEEAQARLDNHKPQIRVTGTLLDTDEIQYGRDWKRGDRVTVQHKGISENVIIKNISMTYQNNKEDLKVIIQGDYV